MVESYQDLEVYRKAYRVSLSIHRMSLTLPKFEQMEIGSQIRRASKSVALNIAEGYGRNLSLSDFKRFLKISLGSCNEVLACLEYCRDLNYITTCDYSKYELSFTEIRKMLISMIKNWK